MSNPCTVVPPKMIYLLESLTSDFNNTIFKMDINTLVKGQNQYSVPTSLNTENISDASKII